MSTANQATRQISFGSLLATVFSSHLRQNILDRKTLSLAVVMLLPILGAGLYLAAGGKSGLDTYKGLLEYVTITFLLPLVCLFQGGPAVVDEIEGRTITYLFLRPVSKPAIFLGKTLAAMVISIALVLVPVIPVFFLSMAAGSDAGANMQFLAQSLVSLLVGCCSYTAVFALLGAVFARSLLAGLLFWAVVEWGLSFIPVLEMGTQKYHLRNAANVIDLGNFGPLDRMILDHPIEVPIWASYSALAAITLGALALGSYLFHERQYLV
jgi:ABC-type transport system involved in multi-copper enzyme maturation permease subunit